MMITVLRCGVLFAAALTPNLLAQAMVVPTDVQMPGTQPGELTNDLLVPTDCNGCHGAYDLAVEQLHNWRGSMMSQATRDPVFWAALAVAEQDFNGSGDFCLRCHTPSGWLGGRSTPTDGSALVASDANGVHCDFCHRATNPDGSEWAGVQNAPFIANDGGGPAVGHYGSAQYVEQATWFPRLGPFDDATAPHPWERSQFHRQAQLCGTCHDVSNPVTGDLAPNNGAQVPLAPGTFSGTPGTPVSGKAAFNNFPYQFGVVERTFSEHLSSGLATLPVSDYPTLPAELQGGALQVAYDAAIAADPSGDYVDGTERTFTCQTCHVPPVTGKGCGFGSVATRTDLPLHSMVGANFFVPELIEYLDTLGGGLVVGGGLSAAELSALAAGRLRALDRLASAATLRVHNDTVEVVNHSGHKLPTGYPEGRRMWLRVTWEDALGAVIRVDGDGVPLNVDIGGTPTVIPDVLDTSDPNLRLYEARHGIDQAWAAKLLTLGLPGSLPMGYDRETGAVTSTLGDLATAAPGTAVESFHFVLNNVVISDDRIPPYGFRHDDAQARNALPVPASQYGDPGPGGVYDHKDTVTLNPPVGAVHAEIELVYEPVSWEYAWFLKQANTGAVSFLASTGEDLLDAWLNAPSQHTAVMATASWDGAWTDLGFALGGTHGEPRLAGSGPLVGGTPMSIALTDALENATAILVVGFADLSFSPFYGGTLVPDVAPPGFFVIVNSGASGEVTLGTTWPAAVPSGFSMWLQWWIQDPGAPYGLAGSNALRAISP